MPQTRTFGGGELTYFEWEPDPEIIAQDMMRLAAYVDDFFRPMLGARNIAIEDTQKHFDTESDPDGVPWPALADDYYEAKSEAGYEEGILVLTGAMREAATSEESWLIIEDSLVFNFDALPRNRQGDVYGLEHQMGTARLKQREFIGLSNEAIEKITALFEAWYDGGANAIFIRGSGVAQFRVPTGRGSETQFGPRFSAES